MTQLKKVIAEDRDTIREKRQRLVEAKSNCNRHRPSLQKENKNVKKCKIFDKKPRRHRRGFMFRASAYSHLHKFE